MWEPGGLPGSIAERLVMTPLSSTLGETPQLDDLVDALGPVPQIRKALAVVSMFGVIEGPLKLWTGQITAEATMKKTSSTTAPGHVALPPEHIAVTSLATGTPCRLLPVADPAVGTTHAYLATIH
jgi:hypothetical protein